MTAEVRLLNFDHMHEEYLHGRDAVATVGDFSHHDGGSASVSVGDDIFAGRVIFYCIRERALRRVVDFRRESVFSLDCFIDGVEFYAFDVPLALIAHVVLAMPQ
jgi:hypothetical protein